MLETGETNQIVAAQNGLRAVALLEPAPVSQQMKRIVRNRSQLYNWRAHKFAIQMLGEMQDRSALPALREYSKLVSNGSSGEALEALRLIVDPHLPPDGEKLVQIQEAIARAIRDLERS